MNQGSERDQMPESFIDKRSNRVTATYLVLSTETKRSAAPLWQSLSTPLAPTAVPPQLSRLSHTWPGSASHSSGPRARSQGKRPKSLPVPQLTWSGGLPLCTQPLSVGLGMPFHPQQQQQKPRGNQPGPAGDGQEVLGLCFGKALL